MLKISLTTKMKKQFYGGILNSLAGNDAKFNYEVLDLNVVKNVNYFDGVENQEVPYTNGIVHFVYFLTSLWITCELSTFFVLLTIQERWDWEVFYTFVVTMNVG
jgi:hypothetical protein